MEQVLRWKLDFNGLTFEKLIGRGGFGEVWKGDYQGTPVAIKKVYNIGSDRMTTELIEKYFGREIDAMISLSNPYIVQLLGLAADEENVFIITEFVEVLIKSKSLPLLTSYEGR